MCLVLNPFIVELLMLSPPATAVTGRLPSLQTFVRAFCTKVTNTRKAKFKAEL